MSNDLEKLPPMLTTQQVGWCLNIARATVNRYVADGRLDKPIKIGGGNRWSKEYIRLLMVEGIPPKAT